jgi:hypothetical protein
VGVDSFHVLIILKIGFLVNVPKLPFAKKKKKKIIYTYITMSESAPILTINEVFNDITFNETAEYELTEFGEGENLWLNFRSVENESTIYYSLSMGVLYKMHQVMSDAETQTLLAAIQNEGMLDTRILSPIKERERKATILIKDIAGASNHSADFKSLSNSFSPERTSFGFEKNEKALRLAVGIIEHFKFPQNKIEELKDCIKYLKDGTELATVSILEKLYTLIFIDGFDQYEFLSNDVLFARNRNNRYILKPKSTCVI